MKPTKHKAAHPIVTFLVLLGALSGIGLVLSLLIPLLLPAYDRYQAEQRAKREAPFLPLLRQYTVRVPSKVYQDLPKSPSDQGITTPKLDGKILVVNLATQSVDGLFHDLPPERRANAPEEVGVVVWMDCDTNTFQYSGPASVSQEHCKVSMIDWSARLIRYQTEFAGESPPQSIPVDEWGMPDYGDYNPNVNREVVLRWILARVE